MFERRWVELREPLHPMARLRPERWCMHCVAREDQPIVVELGPADVPEFAAVVSLQGEHDVSTADEVVATLRSISGNVLVDLGACEFIDSTTISALITASQELEREGQSLELVVPRENVVVSRTVDVVGLRGLLVVHEERPISDDEQDR
jgi:anti-anti-sigma factor